LNEAKPRHLYLRFSEEILIIKRQKRDTRITEIVNAATTKTAKIQQLILLGLTGKEIAGLITNGNYDLFKTCMRKCFAKDV
jgi:hypothetical protein